MGSGISCNSSKVPQRLVNHGWEPQHGWPLRAFLAQQNLQSKWHIGLVIRKKKKSLGELNYGCSDIREDMGEISLSGIGGSKLLSSTLSVHVLGDEVPSLGEVIRFGSESACPCLPSFCGPRCRLLWCLPWTHLIGHVSAQLLSWSKSWWIFPALCPRPQLAT